jgi:hypothetical protein
VDQFNGGGSVAVCTVAFLLAAPAAAEDDKKLEVFKNADLIACTIARIHFCGAGKACTSLPALVGMRFDMEKESMCAIKKPGAKCVDPAKFEAFEGGLVPGLLFVFKETRSMFQLLSSGIVTGTQLLSGAAVTMSGTCTAK